MSINTPSIRWFAAIALALACRFAGAQTVGIPIDGFLPQVGMTLTNQFVDDFDFFPRPTTTPGGQFLGYGSQVNQVALVDTGAAVSLLTSHSDNAFNINGPYSGRNTNFAGTEEITIGGASGFLQARINDPMGLYAAGLQDRTSNSGALGLSNTGTMRGQTNSSIITVPAESDLPNVLGLPFLSQYATRIRNSLPQVFEVDGKTVRSPAIDFHDLGSGGTLGITRKAQLSLLGSTPSSPLYFPQISGDPEFLDKPWNNPSQPTVVQGGHFLNATFQNDGNSLNSQFFFDTGASVTVLSQFKALQMGFDVTTDTPAFTISIVGSGGVKSDVPGFFVDQISIPALGGNVVVQNVPVIVLDVTNVASPGNIVDGIIGTNVFHGRDIVIDPNPSLGGGGASAGVYVSDPVTTDFHWSTPAASGSWSIGANWTNAAAPGVLGVANLRHVTGASQEAVLSTSTQIFEANISGGTSGQTMTARIAAGAKLTTFSGIDIEAGGVLALDGGTVDAQYIELLASSRLTGHGTIRTGSGEIAGQVENTAGVVAPGLAIGVLDIKGRFSNGENGRLEIELAGTVPGSSHDQIVVDGSASLDGALVVSLAGNYSPGLGDGFTLISTTEGLGGTFSSVSLPSAYRWDLDYQVNSLVLSVLGVAGDYNGSGVVDAADYTVWRDNLGSTTALAADGDGNGTVDAGDYAVWQANFGRGLAGSLNSAAVPEPPALLLLVSASLAVACLSTRRKESA